MKTVGSSCPSVRRRFLAITIIVALIFILTHPLVYADTETIRVPVEEGEILFKDLRMEKERYGTPKLQGMIYNNTDKNWKIVNFDILMYGKDGELIKAGILGKPLRIRIFDLKGKSEKPLGITGKGEYVTGLSSQENVEPVRFDIKFIDGRYRADYVISMVKPKANKNLVWEDANIKISFTVTQSQIQFDLRNKTEEPIKIDWNQVSYVDVLGDSHRVMHKGVKLADRENSQPPSTIPPTANISDMVYPTDYVHYSSGKYGGWSEEDMFPDAPKAKLYKGKSFSVFMPLEINGKTKNYFFRFIIDDVIL